MFELFKFMNRNWVLYLFDDALEHSHLALHDEPGSLTCPVYSTGTGVGEEQVHTCISLFQ